jgi:hypothetical protein
MSIPETINQKALARLAPVKLPPTYHVDRSMGSGCAGDPPGFPSYYIQHVYTQFGNAPRKGVQSVILGRVLEHSKDWDGCKDWDQYRAKIDKRMRGLWAPLPIDHPRTRAWIAATIKHHAHCYQSPENQAAGKWDTIIYPVPSYKLKTFTDDPRWNDEYRAAGVREANEYNDMIKAQTREIATIENHEAVILIRRYYPDWTPTDNEADAILFGDVPLGYEQSGQWWETESERPTPENCKPRSCGPHPVNNTWCQFCGWKLTEAEPWDRKTAEQLAAQARQLMRCEQFGNHQHRDQCGACVLRGYLSKSAKADGQKDSDGPNYAGWARVYVQAKQPIRREWIAAFEGQRNSENKAYAAALERDLATFGVEFLKYDSKAA